MDNDDLDPTYADSIICDENFYTSLVWVQHPQQKLCSFWIWVGHSLNFELSTLLVFL